jgi:pseudouridine synthase
MLNEPVRLQKFIASSGRGSRREAEAWIESGKVYVNGRKADLGMKVIPGQDRVTLKGEVLEPPEMVTVIFHKPRGFLCNHDGRREGGTIFDTFSELKGLKVVAGLEKDAAGLIMLSNDGNLMQSFGQCYRDIERVFKIRVKGELPEKLLERLVRGIKFEDRVVKLERIKFLESKGEQFWYEVVMVDHRDRLLEKLFKSLNHPLQRITQVGFAELRDDVLKKGKGRVLTHKELDKLRETIGVTS